MVEAAQPHTVWGGPPQYAANPWQGPPFWHPAGIGRPLAIVAIVLGFVFWWPVGLALLFAMKWSGQMGCGGRRQRAAYANNGWARWPAWNAQPQPAPSSGNHAFDEYRAETIRRLEDEQQAFGSFLERLRFAKDKAEFDQFMTERRDGPVPPTAPTQPSH